MSEHSICNLRNEYCLAYEKTVNVSEMSYLNNKMVNIFREMKFKFISEN